MTPENIVELIRETAEHQSGYDVEYGYGIADVHSALKKILGDISEASIDPCEATAEGNLIGDGDQKSYKIPVTNTLSINLDGPEGADFDLYLKRGAPPTIVDYDKRSYTVKSDETITFPVEEPGDYYVMVKSYRGAGDFKLMIRRE